MPATPTPILAAFDHLARSGPDPRVAGFWDLERGELRTEAFERYLGVASRGDAVYAKFLALVWFGRDRYGLDLSDAADVLDPESRRMLARWVEDPIWP